MTDLESIRRDFVGRVFAEVEGADPITEPAVRHILESLDWDWPGDHDGVLGVRDGETVVPLSAYLTFALPAYRERGTALRSGMLPPLPYHSVPLPWSHRMATSVEVLAGEYPMRIGDRLSSSWSVAGISEATTRLGAGGFIEYETHFRNQRGEHVATERATLLGFEPSTEQAPDAPAAVPVEYSVPATGSLFDPASPRVGALLRPVTLDMTAQRLAMVHAANRDFAVIHNDPVAAAEIGAPGPVMNSMFLLSMVERLLVDNGGAGARVLGLGPVRMRQPTPGGQNLAVRGIVSDVVPSDESSTVHVRIELGGDLFGVTVTAVGTVSVPRRNTADG